MVLIFQRVPIVLTLSSFEYSPGSGRMLSQCGRIDCRLS